jgi:hypothetical protein
MKDENRLNKALLNLSEFLDYSEWIGRVPSAKSEDQYERRMAYWLIHMKQAKAGKSTCVWYDEMEKIASERGLENLFSVDTRKVRPFGLSGTVVGDLSVGSYGKVNESGQSLMVCYDADSNCREIPVHSLLCMRSNPNWESSSRGSSSIVGKMIGCWKILGFHSLSGEGSDWLLSRFDGKVNVVKKISLPSVKTLVRYFNVVSGKSVDDLFDLGSGGDDMTGEVCGRWTVIGLNGHAKSEENGPKGNNECLWCCVCKCGTISTVAGGKLRNGKSKSCGCFRKVAISRRTEETVAAN